jgi:hemoglobin-like flavoprotein
MTPDQVQLIRLTFVQVMSRKQEAGRMFYERLFSIAPDTRPLFRSDIDTQSQKLMDTLALAISGLRDLPSLVSMLEALALRHVGYGARDKHYDDVGAALIWTLERMLGPAFTPAACDAWTALYGTVAGVMRNAAKTGQLSKSAAAGSVA